MGASLHGGRTRNEEFAKFDDVTGHTFTYLAIGRIGVIQRA